MFRFRAPPSALTPWDGTASAIARESFRLPGHEKRMVLTIIDEPENMRRAADQGATYSGFRKG
jgi:hypothetical protein